MRHIPLSASLSALAKNKELKMLRMPILILGIALPLSASADSPPITNPLTAPISIGPATPSMQALPWPRELPEPISATSRLYETPKANYITDLHGSASDADLVIFMAGNQYMVLPELIAAFKAWEKVNRDTLEGKRVEHVFYATTPPGALIAAMDSGKLVIGNFWIDTDEVWPDVFLTGPKQQKTLFTKGYSDGYYLYNRNKGVGLLVRKGNPLGISSVADLARPEVRVAISSPAREPASYESYGAVIDNQGGAGLAAAVLAKSNTLSPLNVHHRENPQFLADGAADVAPMFYHFGMYLTASFPNTFEFIMLPAAGNVIGSLGMTPIEGARHPEEAADWIRFMRSPEARAVYTKYGFDYASDAELNTFVVPQ
jgi:ABC-type molybdate transport system substrate-binding protein